MALTKIGKEGITGISNASDATAITITSGENVGIGTASPSSILHTNNTADAPNGITIQNSSASGTADSYVQFKTNTANVIMGIDATGTDVFKISNSTALGTSDALTIEANANASFSADVNVAGQLDLDVPVATNPAVSVTHTGTGNSTMCIFTQSASNSYNMAEWRNSGGTSLLNFAASGNVTNTNNSYAGISDVKLKENIADANSQWDDIKAVKVRKYSFKTESSETANQLGVVAQELEASGMNGLVVDNIDRDPDTFEDLGTTTKEVKYSILYMKAIKALQEAMTRIEALEARLTAGGL